ncbi:MAG: L-threonylcarbamoyladenylate synthase [bacterium]|nr:L-threonylcarbamoyladenylate synthase [bacterium]
MKIDKNIVKILKSGGVGILPTDTLYGLVGSALNKKAVERIYEIKKRGEAKPFIILIFKIKDLKLFGAEVGKKEKAILKRYWPGQVSVILDCPSLPKEMSYLQPLNNTLAFRCPKEKWLYNVLRGVGPLVAPSANPEGLASAENIEQARIYFNNSVDFYVDGGELKGQPSTIIKLNENGFEIRRQGAIEIKN